MVSNAGVDLVGIYGMANPDWLLASTEPGLKCDGLKDQPVGVDAVGGARAVALAAFLRACGLKVDQVKLVALSSNVGAAMIAGQIKYWPLEDDRLGKTNLDRVIATEKDLGGIKPGKEPVSYERLVDRGVWKDAEALLKN